MTDHKNQTTQNCHHGIIPPYILEAIVKNGTAVEIALAQNTLAIDQELRSLRMARPTLAPPAGQGVEASHKNRLIYNEANSTALPGTLVRSEGGNATGDAEADEAYNGLGATFDLYYNVYGRNSIDNNGLDLKGSVHYGVKYDNAFWNGSQMVFGDGDGIIFNRFTISVDVMGHELTHGVTAATAGLQYQNQSGALNESISDVFGSLVKQYVLKQTAAQADWLIGAGIFVAGINGVALRSMQAPGTAYNDPKLGKDPQPVNMSGYVNTTGDNGGVHINSGIPNRAFYLVATAIGGDAWKAAGNIWYRTLLDSRLASNAQFKDFANLTVDNANRMYGRSTAVKVVQAWKDVGIDVALPPPPPAAIGDPVAYAFVNNPTGLVEQHNLYRSTNGHIQALWFNFAQGWHYEDRTAILAGVPPTVGQPSCYAFINNPTGVVEQHNLFRSGDGHIHALWFNFATGWHHEDRTTLLPGVPSSVGQPFGYAFVNNDTGVVEQHNLFRAADGHIHALWCQLHHRLAS